MLTDPFDSLEGPDVPEDATPAEPRPTVIAEANGIRMTIDLHQMLTAIDPRGSWVAYNPEHDEDMWEPSSLTVQIAEATANHLVKAMRREVKTMIEDKVGDQITQQVKALVREHIEGTDVTETDEFGHAKGTPPKPLTQMIVQAATKGLHQADHYGRGQSPMQKMVDEAVGRAFKNELAEAVKTAKQQALAAVQNSAAEVIRETIERSARGLL